MNDPMNQFLASEVQVNSNNRIAGPLDPMVLVVVIVAVAITTVAVVAIIFGASVSGSLDSADVGGTVEIAAPSP